MNQAPLPSNFIGVIL